MRQMNMQRFQDLLYQTLLCVSDTGECDEGVWNENHIKQVRSFADEGMLTSNLGLVVRMEDGSHFQITIVKSK